MQNLSLRVVATTCVSVSNSAIHKTMSPQRTYTILYKYKWAHIAQSPMCCTACAIQCDTASVHCRRMHTRTHHTPHTIITFNAHHDFNANIFAYLTLFFFISPFRPAWHLSARPASCACPHFMFSFRRPFPAPFDSFNFVFSLGYRMFSVCPHQKVFWCAPIDLSLFGRALSSDA